jgi:hypothetical protein
MSSDLPGLVRVRAYRGGLGNRLSHYCFARRVAVELGFDLMAPAIDGFPNAVSLGQAARRDMTSQEYQKARTLHRLNLSALLADRSARLIDLVGTFLRYEYFCPYKHEIRSDWLHTGPLPTVHAEDLTIHVRTGDVWLKGCQAAYQAGKLIEPRVPGVEYHTLPYSFYTRIIEHQRWRTIHVVTEDATDPMAQKLASRFGAQIRSGTMMEDFNFLRASHNLVLSVSTFAWWAGWLSGTSRVYYPVLGFFDPERAQRRPRSEQQDLWVPDEDRYWPVRVPAPEGYWRGTEEDRQRLLES